MKYIDFTKKDCKICNVNEIAKYFHGKFTIYQTEQYDEIYKLESDFTKNNSQYFA